MFSSLVTSLWDKTFGEHLIWRLQFIQNTDKFWRDTLETFNVVWKSVKEEKNSSWISPAAGPQGAYGSALWAPRL